MIIEEVFEETNDELLEAIEKLKKEIGEQQKQIEKIKKLLNKLGGNDDN